MVWRSNQINLTIREHALMKATKPTCIGHRLPMRVLKGEKHRGSAGMGILRPQSGVSPAVFLPRAARRAWKAGARGGGKKGWG